MHMLSSISNSRSRIAGNLMLHSWGLGVLLLVGCEFVLRGSGFTPALHDSMALWAEQRALASQSDGNTVVLLGASRMERDIVPEELAVLLPGKKVVMLAIDGRPPMATLEDLAADPRFRGTIVCDLDVHRMVPSSWNFNAQGPYVEYYRKDWSVWNRLILSLEVAAQENLVLFHHRFAIKNLFAPYQEELFRTHLVLRRNRFEEAHYNRLTPDLRRIAIEMAYDHYKSFYVNNPFPSPSAMQMHYSHIEVLVERLLKKGCHIVFLRLPTSGKIWELDQQYLPKELYWDQFARQTKAKTIHFKDYESLKDYDCPEGSHLDYKEAIAFTRALGMILKKDICIEQ